MNGFHGVPVYMFRLVFLLSRLDIISRPYGYILLEVSPWQKLAGSFRHKISEVDVSIEYSVPLTNISCREFPLGKLLQGVSKIKISEAEVTIEHSAHLNNTSIKPMVLSHRGHFSLEFFTLFNEKLTGDAFQH